MAYVHIALFKWAASAASSEVDEALKMAQLAASRTDGVTAVYCGENLSKLANGFSHCLVVVGESAETISRYASDELHRRAATLIGALKEEIVGVAISNPA